MSKPNLEMIKTELNIPTLEPLTQSKYCEIKKIIKNAKTCQSLLQPQSWSMVWPWIWKSWISMVFQKSWNCKHQNYFETKSFNPIDLLQKTHTVLYRW